MSHVYCQDAYNAGDKPTEGRDRGVVEGCVFSPRYRSPEGPWDIVSEFAAGHRAILDPETYLVKAPVDRLGRLPDWPYWAEVHRAPRRALVSAYRAAVEPMLSQQAALGFSVVTASGPLMPGLYGYEQAVLSEVASEAENWAASNKPQGGLLLAVPIQASALERQSDSDPDEPHEDLDTWLDTMTALPDHGFYFVVDWVTASYEMPDDPVVLSNLMYLTHSLGELNERRVIFGYCGLWGVLMAAAGADAIASGWYLSTRRFATERFERAGGRATHRRVWIRELLSEMTEPELHAVCEGCTAPPGTSDTLAAAYRQVDVPHTRSQRDETMHNWRVLGDILNCLNQPTAEERTNHCLAMVEAARAFYQQHCAPTEATRRAGVHLDGWRNAILRFHRMMQWG